jgi:hypothetical protein
VGRSEPGSSGHWVVHRKAHNTVNTLKSVTAALILIVVTALATPAAAQATPAWADSKTASVTFSPPTAAAEPCEAGWLCLYRNTDYVNKKFQTQRHNTCWNLADYGLVNAVYSYNNRLSVYAHFYDSAGNNVWNIRNGGHSSDSTQWAGEYRVCTD